MATQPRCNVSGILEPGHLEGEDLKATDPIEDSPTL